MYTPGATWKNASGLFAHVYDGSSGIGAGQASGYETDSLSEHGMMRRVLQVVAWGQALLSRCIADLHASSICTFGWATQARVLLARRVENKDSSGRRS